MILDTMQVSATSRGQCIGKMLIIRTANTLGKIVEM